MENQETLFMTSTELAKNIALQVVEHRIRLNYKQKDFAKKIGMALRTYERFEHTGKVSFENLLSILAGIGKKDIITKALVLDQVEQLGIEAFIEKDNVKKRKRVRD
jgi:DNA-binding XRE family transcriptional regulator